MWFTILNREKLNENLFRKAFAEVCEEKQEANMILGYGYLSEWFEIKESYACVQAKCQMSDIWEVFKRSNIKKVIIVTTDEERERAIGIARKISRIKKMEVIVLEDKSTNYKHHKKFAITYNGKNVINAVIGIVILQKLRYMKKIKENFKKILMYCMAKKKL